MKGKNNPILKQLGRFATPYYTIGKAIKNYNKYREANRIAAHFAHYLHPIVASSQTMKEQSYAIRHNVYCDELKLEKQRHNKLETDEFDNYSISCLIQHLSSNTMAGTVRIVRPTHSSHLLPIEKYCSHAIADNSLYPAQFSRNQICEVSRLAIPAIFRRRSTDTFSRAQFGGINIDTFTDCELRCFPFISVGLYLTAAAIVMQHDIEHIYVMVEPRLAKSMRLVGIKFKQIGPVIDYHGKRAAHHLDSHSLHSGLSAGFAAMRDDILAKIKRQ